MERRKEGNGGGGGEDAAAGAGAAVEENSTKSQGSNDKAGTNHAAMAGGLSSEDNTTTEQKSDSVSKQKHAGDDGDFEEDGDARPASPSSLSSSPLPAASITSPTSLRSGSNATGGVMTRSASLFGGAIWRQAREINDATDDQRILVDHEAAPTVEDL